MVIGILIKRELFIPFNFWFSLKYITTVVVTIHFIFFNSVCFFVLLISIKVSLMQVALILTCSLLLFDCVFLLMSFSYLAPLHIAADKAHYDVMDVLLKHGAKVNSCSFVEIIWHPLFVI